jgi:glutathione synthase/RimK-type ligase-like ATP-grasp enzyme
MILLCGLRQDMQLLMVAHALRRLGCRYVLLDQRTAPACKMTITFDGREVRGDFHTPSWRCRLEDISGVYLRLVDESALPKDARRSTTEALHDSLYRYCDVTKACVVNRPWAAMGKVSKPHELQSARAAGFEVPETLVTDDLRLIREFWDEHGRVVYKSLSGVRSKVALLTVADLARLHMPPKVPVQLQAYVEGDDWRVHVVGEELFVTRIRAGAVDYRYATPGELESISAVPPAEVPTTVARRCVELTREAGLAFSGIDLRHRPDGRTVFLELNPEPGFSYYQSSTHQPIASAVARNLRDGLDHHGLGTLGGA